MTIVKTKIGTQLECGPINVLPDLTSVLAHASEMSWIPTINARLALQNVYATPASINELGQNCLIEVSAWELGFEAPVAREEIYHAALCQGLALLEVRLAVSTRFAYRTQPERDQIVLATDFIPIGEHDQVLLMLECRDQKSIIEVHFERPGCKWFPHVKWLFLQRVAGSQLLRDHDLPRCRWFKDYT